MSDAVFATKWHFLFARVLIGVDRTTGVWSGSEPTPGQQLVAVWTSEDVATEALHVESWELRPIEVRDLVAMLPPGVGVVVDPERSTGMTASASYVANLKSLLVPFPMGSEVRLGAWESMPDAVRHAVVQAAVTHRVQQLHAFIYAIDDSPPLGCLAYDPAAGSDPAAVGAALEAALAAATDRESLALAGVRVVALDDVPDEVRVETGEAYLIHGHRRVRRLWRRP